ncbi:MAG: hypothetical protein BWY17_04481 [Deltaproteobacteria bacterium ADurb.Bin207]|nr:MAG: hypothetical protein BWY17_04481 [Deltaproteobacteria bacterium ADurb.Bin207]
MICFGKIPSDAEFLRYGTWNDAAVELQRWLEKASEYAATRHKDTWKLLDSQSPLRFLFRCTQQDTALAGVVIPSSDTLGRAFPLMLAAEISVRHAGRWAHTLPIALQPFFDQAAQMISRIHAASDLKDADEWLRDLQLSTLERLQDHEQPYEDWACGQPLHALLHRLLGSQGESMLHTLFEATDPFRNVEAPSTNLSLLVPLQAPEDLTLCFWLHVLRCAYGWKKTVPGFFAHGQSALIPLGATASPSVLIDCWLPDQPSQYVCSASTDTSKYSTTLPDRIRELLDTHNATAFQLASRFESCNRSHHP